MTLVKHGERWTTYEDNIVTAEFGVTPLDELATRLGRTSKAVRERKRQLDLHGQSTWKVSAEALSDVDVLLYVVRHAFDEGYYITIDGLGTFIKAAA